MDFTATVKAQMHAQHIAPRELAGKMGFTDQYIYKLLKGQKRWNETTMTRACEALGLKVDFSVEPTGPEAANQ